MGCLDIDPITFDCGNSERYPDYCFNLSEEVLKNILQLPDNVRKEVRLIAKQYFLTEVLIEHEASTEIGALNFRRSVLVLFYQNENYQTFKREYRI